MPDHLTTDELHQVWDSVLFSYQGYLNLPFSDGDWSSLSANATRLMNSYNISDSVANDLNPVHWADDSYRITTEFVYTQVKENSTVPQSYVDKGREYAERQIVTAGHRLANLLVTLPLSGLELPEVPEEARKIIDIDPLFLN